MPGGAGASTFPHRKCSDSQTGQQGQLAKGSQPPRGRGYGPLHRQQFPGWLGCSVAYPLQVGAVPNRQSSVVQHGSIKIPNFVTLHVHSNIVNRKQRPRKAKVVRSIILDCSTPPWTHNRTVFFTLICTVLQMTDGPALPWAAGENAEAVAQQEATDDVAPAPRSILRMEEAGLTAGARLEVCSCIFALGMSPPAARQPFSPRPKRARSRRHAGCRRRSSGM